MKIIQIISSLSSGGAERFVVDLSNNLAEMGHNVTVCTMNDNDYINFNKQFLCPKISYHSLQIKGKNIFVILKEAYKFVTSIKPDIIHCHLAVLQYIFPICVFNRKIKVFHTIHSMPKYASGGDAWHAKLFKFLYKTNLVVPITISEECHQGYKKFYGLSNDYLIKNGVSPLKFSSRLAEVVQKVNAYKQTPQTPVFIHVARYHEAKNQKLLIDSFNKLYNDGISFCLLVLGRDFDFGEGAVLKNASCPNIHFLGEKNNVSDYLSCSNYFCLSSIYEGLPISLLEAMSLGVIPICTPVGGIKDLINDGINGFLSKNINNDSYVITLIRALNSKIKAENCIFFYKKNYSMKRCALQYIKLFKS